MKKFQKLGLFTALTMGLDLGTKALIETRFSLYETVPVIKGFFNLTYVQNTGAAFSILSNAGSFRTPLFAGVTLAAAAFVIWLTKTQGDEDKNLPVFLGLILGGALGNLADRLRHGAVVDFLDVYIGKYHWPAFNVADSAICVGVGLILFMELTKHRKHPS
jgi:signal peptidase II